MAPTQAKGGTNSGGVPCLAYFFFEVLVRFLACGLPIQDGLSRQRRHPSRVPSHRRGECRQNQRADGCEGVSVDRRIRILGGLKEHDEVHNASL